jgi:hypothetical protein
VFGIDKERIKSEFQKFLATLADLNARTDGTQSWTPERIANIEAFIEGLSKAFS